MASFWSKFQIFVLLSSNNKCNLLVRQQPWHHIRSILYSRKAINDNCNGKSILPKGKCRCGGPKRKRFWNFQRRLSKNKKPILCKEQTFFKRKSSLWQRIFVLGPRKSCRLTYHEKPQICEENSRLLHPCCSITPKDICTESLKSNDVEPQPKSPPEFKVPTAVLLSKMMLNGCDQKVVKVDDCEDKKVTYTFRKPYDEMKPPCKRETKCYKELEESEKVKSEDIKSYITPTCKINMVSHDSTITILHKGMKQNETRTRSKYEQLRLLTNEKMPKSQRASLLSRMNSKLRDNTFRDNKFI